MEEKIAERIGEMVANQYGLGALLVVGLLALVVTVLRESAKLREEIAYQVSRDLLDRRFEAYGALWKCMKPVAIYSDAPFGPPELNAMRGALSSWYFSQKGGLFLTVKARDFYFIFQDILAEMGRLGDWQCDARPDEPKEIFLKVAEAAGVGKEILVALDDGKDVSAKGWRCCCQAVSSHLGKLLQNKDPLAGNGIFACVQQASSVLRTVLSGDVQSRLDARLPTPGAFAAFRK